MDLPQITLIILFTLSFAENVLNQGKPTNSKFGVGSWFIKTAIFSTILYYGGFWG